MKQIKLIIFAQLLLTILIAQENIQQMRPGLQNLRTEQLSTASQTEIKLLQNIYLPMLTGKDVTIPLQAWFDGRLALEKKHDQILADKLFQKGIIALQKKLPLLKVEKPKPVPDATLTFEKQLKNLPQMEQVTTNIVSWKIGKLKQYGILIQPVDASPQKQYPLIVYAHGAAYGIPYHFLPWLAKLSRSGYAVIAPAMRGEDLFVTNIELLPLGTDFSKYRSEGKIENLLGEVDDLLAAAVASKKLKTIQSPKYTVMGHSFGGGAALLTTARDKNIACSITYDAWLVNPFRYSWERMCRQASNWDSWETYCNKKTTDILKGLIQRSITHQASQINCPLLMFMGGAYNGSVFHKSHSDFILYLKNNNKKYIYDLVPKGVHNFILYPESEPAKHAIKIQDLFLNKYFPPLSTQKRQTKK